MTHTLRQTQVSRSAGWSRNEGLNKTLLSFHIAPTKSALREAAGVRTNPVQDFGHSGIAGLLDCTVVISNTQEVFRASETLKPKNVQPSVAFQQFIGLMTSLRSKPADFNNRKC